MITGLVLMNSTLGKQVLRYVIRPTLAEIGLAKPFSDALVHGTFMAESGYLFLSQMGDPANGGLGFGQDEPSDYIDARVWLTNGINAGLYQRILKSCQLTELPKDPTILKWHLKLMVCMTRVHYLRVREPIPETAEGLSNYHKVHYNGPGKADPQANIAIFAQAIKDCQDGG